MWNGSVNKFIRGKKWSLEKCGQEYKSNKYQNHTSNKFSWSDTTEKCQLFKNNRNKCKKQQQRKTQNPASYEDKYPGF